MTNEIQFYLDENVTNDIAEGLRTRAIEVLTTPEAGNMGLEDDKQLAFALAEKRVIITHDRDILRLSNQGISHAGIAYCAQKSRTVKEMLHRLMSIHRDLTAEEMANRVEFL